MVKNVRSEASPLFPSDVAWNYIQAFAGAVDYIGKTYGDEAVEEYWKSRGLSRNRSLLGEAAKEGPEKLMNRLYDNMDAIPDGDFKLEEEEDRWILRGRCGSGGRWVREGKAERNQAGVPYYCVHCPIWWDEQAKQAGLNMSFVRTEDGTNCAWIVEPEQS